MVRTCPERKTQDDEYLFITLTYNHQPYIIEHLESIRYQIQCWAEGRACSIVLADDGSRDDTVALARSWLEAHRELFAQWEILESPWNLGTCANFTRVFPRVRGKRIKVLAGDDLYSAESIFELVDTASEGTLVSGLPLMLYPEGLALSRGQVFNMLASEAIYGRDFLGAMRGFSAIHTPSLAYDSAVMEISGMAEFISSFSVVEDFAMQIRLAEARPWLHYQILPKFHVYYRRTHQSTYLIKRSAFVDDKARMYRYLAQRERNPVLRALILNRIPCLTMRGGLKYVANANTLVYGERVVVRLPGILKRLSEIDCPMERYRAHLRLVRGRAEEFLARRGMTPTGKLQQEV